MVTVILGGIFAIVYGVLAICELAFGIWIVIITIKGFLKREFDKILVVILLFGIALISLSISTIAYIEIPLLPKIF